MQYTSMIMMFYIAVLAMTTTSTCSFLHKTLSINHRFQLSKTILSATINDQSIDQGIKIKSCNNMDISRAANFLGQYWFDEDTEMSRSQRQEFIRLENTDLTRRYGEIVGRRNSTLLMATESEEIVGCVGIDSQRFYPEQKRFRSTLQSRGAYDYEVDDTSKVVIVLANLVVRRDRRKQGLGKMLLRACEEKALSWGFTEMYLQVSSINMGAQKLYTSQGYKLVFVDEDATCVLPGKTSLQTAPCINYCYRKALKSSPSGGDFADKLKSLFSFFNK